jgi:glycosyltransferase involved in cell wall biosynthesis
VTDATILVPTHRHVSLLPYALESALDQEGASVELLVVGDGVEDSTREVVARYADDARVRFFDLPKGPRNGEAHRHAVLGEATGRIVCYLSDDDLLLREHAAEMGRLLQDADFAHPPSTRLLPDGELQFFPWNYSRAEFREAGRTRVGSVGLTGVAHTLEAYRRLPLGWRTTPAGLPTDHYMWRQWLELPGLRAVMGERLTYLNFPDPFWKEVADEERAAALADWLRRSREPGFGDELDRTLGSAIRKAAEDYHLWARNEHRNAEALRTSKTWRLRRRLVRRG